MAVNLSVPLASELKPVSGLELGYAKANIKKADRKDLLVMKLAPEATVAGVFDQKPLLRSPRSRFARPIWRKPERITSQFVH